MLYWRVPLYFACVFFPSSLAFRLPIFTVKPVKGLARWLTNTKCVIRWDSPMKKSHSYPMTNLIESHCFLGYLASFYDL